MRNACQKAMEIMRKPFSHNKKARITTKAFNLYVF